MEPSSLMLCLLYVALAWLIRMRFPNRFTTGLLLTVVVISAAVMAKQHRRELNNAWRWVAAWAEMPYGSDLRWPPQVGQPFPDLLLYDQEGRLVRLSSLRGRVLLVELAATCSPASIALAGGHAYGPFQNVAPQTNLDSMNNYLKQFGPVEADPSRWLHVRIVVFNHQLGAPSLADVQQWARHFNLDASEGQFVLAGNQSLCSATDPSWVPGFYLVDSQFTVRAECVGPTPKHNLYTDIIPLLHDLVKESQPRTRAAAMGR
jgi:hypothetical protein